MGLAPVSIGKKLNHSEVRARGAALLRGSFDVAFPATPAARWLQGYLEADRH